MLVFVMVTDSLPSGLRFLVTFCLLPNASLVNFEIDSLPSELRVLVMLCLLPNSSVLDVVMLTDCAEAVAPNESEIARAAARTAQPSVVPRLSPLIVSTMERLSLAEWAKVCVWAEGEWRIVQRLVV